MRKTRRSKNTLKNKKLPKSKTGSKIRKIKNNSKKKRLYLGGMDSVGTILDTFDFDEEYGGYRYLETTDLSIKNTTNSLSSFATKCAFILKEASGNPYDYSSIPNDDDDDDDDDDDMKYYYFTRKNRDFNPTLLDDFAFGRSKDEFIQILKNQLNAFESSRNSPYVCALRQVYKIHLQPKLEYLKHYIEALITLYGKIETLRNGISAFKVTANYDKCLHNNFPVIVLYIKDVNSTWDILQILKNNIVYKPESSIDIVPRHNYGIRDTHNILYIANGDGDIKNTIIDNGLQELDDGSNIISNVFEDTPDFPNAFIIGSEIFNELEKL